VTRFPLKPHPSTPCRALESLEVELLRITPRRLLLRFLPTPGFRHVRMRPPGLEGPQRRDELWRHTCFEAFIRPAGGEAYYEFNLAGSGDWNAYRFTGYREGMEPVREVGPPRLDPYYRGEPRAAAMALLLELNRLHALPLYEPWHVGISAVIEDRNGRISYWALAHPPGEPDFHHPDCFALTLPAARGA
jgi:hypothetical protein